MKRASFALVVFLTSLLVHAEQKPHWLDNIKEFPKGADLHNHLVGATYAEALLQYGKNDKACFNKRFYAVDCPSDYKITTLIEKPALERQVVDAWSMQDFQGAVQQRHAHFFETFLRFWPYAKNYNGAILAEIIQRAADQNILFIETMINPDDFAANDLAKTMPEKFEFTSFQKKLEEKGINTLIEKSKKNIDDMEQQAKQILQCDKQPHSAACQLPVRYQYLALRGIPQQQVFASLLLGFKLAEADPRVVAVNLVLPEDNPTALKDYDQHMKMFAYFHKQFPKVKISLHAGELSKAFATPTQLSYHIHDAVFVANANRIGHGTDIQHEKNSKKTLAKMATDKIAVEINLTSNEILLDSTPKNHPLHTYIKHQVPVVLSTDDEGVLRTNLSNEYKKAATHYKLSYAQLKQISRDSLTYAFVEGESLWQDPKKQILNSACQGASLGDSSPNPNCQTFLDKNLKARLQWQLEEKLKHFEDRTSR